MPGRNRTARKSRRAAVNPERLIYPPLCYEAYDGPDLGHDVAVPYDLYVQTRATKEVGDTIVHEAGAPGRGHIVYRITRMDTIGVYGVVVENTIRCD